MRFYIATKGVFIMEKKHFSYTIIILLIVLIFLLSGCIPLSDEAEITYLINRYYAAINKQIWDKARSYCIYNSTPNIDVNDIENNVAGVSSLIEDVILDYSFYIKDIAITGKYATVLGFLNITITIHESIQEASGDKTINVEKIDNIWKLY